MPEKIQIGTIIRIKKMKGEPQYEGKEGTITHIDDIGQFHGTWGGCAVIPGEDEFEIIGVDVKTRISDVVKDW